MRADNWRVNFCQLYVTVDRPSVHQHAYSSYLVCIEHSLSTPSCIMLINWMHSYQGSGERKEKKRCPTNTWPLRYSLAINGIQYTQEMQIIQDVLPDKWFTWDRAGDFLQGWFGPLMVCTMHTISMDADRTQDYSSTVIIIMCYECRQLNVRAYGAEWSLSGVSATIISFQSLV